MNEHKKDLANPCASPCIKACCLNDKDICVGCFRSLDEILTWTTCSDREKTQVLERCARRKSASDKG